MTDILIPQVNQAPYFEQYLGAWAIREQEGEALAALARQMDLTLHLQSPAAARAIEAGNSTAQIMSITDGVAEIYLSGTLMKHVGSMSNGTSTALARRAVREAARNPDVTGIMLMIDSPGGTVAGTKDLADEIAAAAESKPVHAYIEDLGASAAYWIASQATSITANPTALVGSIGTYTVVYDMSSMAAKEGVKVHVVRAGDYKGAGIPGTEVTQGQLAEVQRTINSLNSFFMDGVERGRKMNREQLAGLADGRVHIASEAKRLQLIDHVGTYESVRASMDSKPKRNGGARASDAGGDFGSEVKGETMTEQSQGPKAATIAEIKAECVGATADFVLAQAEAGATIEQAKSAWMKQLTEANAKLQADAEKAKAEAEKAKASPAVKAKSGIPAIVQEDVTPVGGSARDEWLSLVADAKKSGLTNAQACSRVNRQNPGLRERMIAEDNAAA